MEFLTQLWLPILLSAVFVFVISSIIHMVLPYHRSDWSKLPDEDTVLDAMRTAGLGRGVYMFPAPDSMKECNTPEMKAKIQRGPCGTITILPPGGWNMGRGLTLWFVQSLIIGALAGYVGWESLGANADYLKVFQITGAACVLGYAIGHMHDSIWKGVSWTCTAKFIFDGVVYALITAGTFGWLWPSPEMPVVP